MRIYLDAVGCRLNQSEIELMGSRFRRAGHALVAEPAVCDLVVVNTCAVTARASADSRTLARKAHRQCPEARLILTGCWATLEPERASSLPGVWLVVANSSKDDLVSLALGLSPDMAGPARAPRVPLPGRRGRTRAFIKAQDGCDNHCTFCLTRIARGPARSTPMPKVIEAVQSAVAGGAREIVLTGVELSAYGADLPVKTTLMDLVKAILLQTDVARLRLSSLEPWALPDGFFDLWQDPRMCRQLHLPLQSGSLTTLQRMARPIEPMGYATVAQTARAAVPGLALTSDIMVGFPGETDADFEESLLFVAAAQFSRAHVFIYSLRPGTPAYRFAGRVSSPRSKERSLRVRQVVDAAMRSFEHAAVGTTASVLWESAIPNGTHGWDMTGWSDNYLRVTAHATQDLRNRISMVELTSAEAGSLRGQILDTQ